MTDQISDNFIFDGEIMPLTSLPSLPRKNSLVLDQDYDAIYGDDRVLHTGCHRLYVATWAVINKRPFLIDIIGRFSLKDNRPVFAEWITETLIYHKGRMFEEYEDQGLHLYEEDIHIEIEQGILVNVKRVNNVNFRRFFHFKDAQRFSSLASDYYNEPFTLKRSGELWKVTWRRRSNPNDMIFIPMQLFELEELHHEEVVSGHDSEGVNREDSESYEFGEKSSLIEEEDGGTEYYEWNEENYGEDLVEDEYPNVIIQELDEERDDWASSGEDGWYYQD